MEKKLLCLDRLPLRWLVIVLGLAAIAWLPWLEADSSNAYGRVTQVVQAQAGDEVVYQRAGLFGRRLIPIIRRCTPETPPDVRVDEPPPPVQPPVIEPVKEPPVIEKEEPVPTSPWPLAAGAAVLGILGSGVTQFFRRVQSFS